MTIKQFLSPQYLFHTNTAFISPSEKLFLFAGAILVLLAIVLKIAGLTSQNPIDKQLRNKFYRLFLYTGIGELVWYVCRWQHVTFFSTPFMAWLIALIGIVWLGFIAVWVFRNYKSGKMEWEKQQVKLRYLPK